MSDVKFRASFHGHLLCRFDAGDPTLVSNPFTTPADFQFDSVACAP
jgi:hypothetical protein